MVPRGLPKALGSGPAVDSADTGRHWSGSSVFDPCSECQFELDRRDLADVALSPAEVTRLIDPASWSESN
jgi:hypothetical protein